MFSRLIFLLISFCPVLGVKAEVSGLNEATEIKVNAPPLEKPSPFMMYFDPQDNGVLLEKQKIDYDLTTEYTLRMGPYVFGPDDVSMQMTREQGEVFEVEFGMEVKKRLLPLYVLSFRWPKDFLDTGLLEIIDDKNQSVWARRVSEKDLNDWEQLITVSSKPKIEDLTAQNGASNRKLGLARPEKLNKIHRRSTFGLAHTGFFEFPIAQLKGPFRFCLSRDDDVGRLALCSRRYEITRRFGRYDLHPVQTEVRPRVMVNDKPVTLKGTAVFLQYDIPIKFSALIKNGSYFEFVAHPKEIHVVDMVEDRENRLIEIIGYGDEPMGLIGERFYADTVHWGVLNFMPSIGDLRRFWRVRTPSDSPYLYLRGKGGAPFRQHFVFDSLPEKSTRLILDSKTQRTTYSSVANLKGHVKPDVEVHAEDTDVKRLSPTEFEWSFLAPEKGQLNKGYLIAEENGKKYKAYFEVYRGRATEVSGRLTGVVSDELDLVLLGEVAAQHWFEKILGWENYHFSKLRWGFAAKYFDTLALANPKETGFISLSVANFDLKYRFTPGIWGRDPSVGLLFSGQNVKFNFKRSGQDFEATAPMIGGGMFWARSMPKFIDDFFNLAPFMRYPKWVDAEAILYPLILKEGRTPVFSLAFNFHGKVQWTPSFFGEAGFGIKNFAWDDATVGPRGTSIGVAIAYGTVGIGYNF